MKSIIIPTNFSPEAYDAARYAIALSLDLKADRIVLFNSCETYISDDPSLNIGVSENLMELKKISEEGLLKMKNTLQPEAPSIQFVYESDYAPIVAGIELACKKYNARTIIMGIGRSGAGNTFEEMFIGSNAVDLALKTQATVFIIPPHSKYAGLKKLLLAFDFKDTDHTLLFAQIKETLDITNAHLDIVHIYTNDDDKQTNFEAEKNLISNSLGNHHYEFHFIQGNDFTDAISKFSNEHTSDLVIVVPKKHGFFEGLFKRSHTKALAFHSNIPVMVMHE